MKAFNITSDGTVNIDFSHVIENPLINGIEIIRTDIPAPPPAGADNLTTVAFTGTTATADQRRQPGHRLRQLARRVRGRQQGVLRLHRRLPVLPHVRPARLSGRPTRSTRTTTRPGPTSTAATARPSAGWCPSLYGQIPNVTGMFFSGGRLYYTLFGDSHLYSRWFSPDSGIVDETTTTSSSSVDFSLADGMFAGRHHLVLRLQRGRQPALGLVQRRHRVRQPDAWSADPVVDGVNWTSRATFLTGTPANIAPTAAFTSSCTNRSCTFDASGSSDSDGSIASYAWTFGDGSNGTGVNPAHAYTADGNFTVTLTVTDNRGGTNSVSHGVSVSLPTVAFVAAADAGGGNTTSKTLTIPAAAHTGDTALLFLSKTSTATWSDPTGVTGWTQVGSYTTGTLVTTAWVKALATGDPGATVRFTSSAASHASANVAVYSGVSTTNPIVTSAQAGDAARTTHTTPTITAAGGNWVVSFWSDRSTATRTWTTPAGVSARDSSTDTGTLDRPGGDRRLRRRQSRPGHTED